MAADRLLALVDRSDPVTQALAERLEEALYRIDDLDQALSHATDRIDQLETDLEALKSSDQAT